MADTPTFHPGELVFRDGMLLIQEYNQPALEHAQNDLRAIKEKWQAAADANPTIKTLHDKIRKTHSDNHLTFSQDAILGRNTSSLREPALQETIAELKHAYTSHIPRETHELLMAGRSVDQHLLELAKAQHALLQHTTSLKGVAHDIFARERMERLHFKNRNIGLTKESIAHADAYAAEIAQALNIKSVVLPDIISRGAAQQAKTGEKAAETVTAAEAKINPGKLVFKEGNLEIVGASHPELDKIAASLNVKKQEFINQWNNIPNIDELRKEFIRSLPEAEAAASGNAAKQLMAGNLGVLKNENPVLRDSAVKLDAFMTQHGGQLYADYKTEAAKHSEQAAPWGVELRKAQLPLFEGDITKIEGYTSEAAQEIEHQLQVIKQYLTEQIAAHVPSPAAGEAIKTGEEAAKAGEKAAEGAGKEVTEAAKTAEKEAGFWARNFGGIKTPLASIKENLFTKQAWAGEGRLVGTVLKGAGTATGIGIIIDATTRGQATGPDGQPVERSGTSRITEGLVGAVLTVGSATHGYKR